MYTLLALLQPSEQNGLFQGPVMLLLMFGVMYFALFAPQAKQKKQLEQTLTNLKKGDEVVTAGGIVGEVVHIRESMKDGQPVRSMEDRVTIKSAESRLVVERGRIARVVPRVAADAGTAA